MVFCFIYLFVVVFLFFDLFLDLDVYVLYQSSFGIFYVIKVVSFYLHFIYFTNMGKTIFHKILFFLEYI